MVGATINAQNDRKASVCDSALTLDSHLVDGGSKSSSTSIQVNYHDLIFLKIKVAELQTELQIQESHTSKYQSLLAQAQQKNQSLELDIKALTDNAENEANRRLRKMIKELSSKSRKYKSLPSDDASEPSSDSSISQVSDDKGNLILGNESLKSADAVIPRTMMSKFKESFCSERTLKTSPITASQASKRLCKSISTSLTASFTAITMETDMESTLGDSSRSFMSDLGSEK